MTSRAGMLGMGEVGMTVCHNDKPGLKCGND